ncbi:MAG: SIR2 family protein [Acidobacteriia bacterium]|nr:SIR2 family protein [Terriglobia bacterium]
MKDANQGEKKAIFDGLINLFSQNRHGWLVFFGTGTSCALDRGFGMLALEEHLRDELRGDRDWSQVESQLDAGGSLERALTGIGLSEETKSKIREVTGSYVASIDLAARNDLLLGRKRWVGDRLIKALTQSLAPRNPRLPVVTSNYDMLIEYSCASQDIRYTTGFVGDVIRVWSWEGAQDSLNQCRVSRRRSQDLVLTNPVRRVELFKVHGSVNRFNDLSKNRQVECDLWTMTPPEGFQRVIAPPGDQKYEEYAGNIETAAGARQAEGRASAFIMAGYGFNDPLLHQRIEGRVRQHDCPLVVLTRSVRNDKVERLHELGKRVWILVASRTGSEVSDDTHTVVYPPGNARPVILENERLWSCDSFAERILGG